MTERVDLEEIQRRLSAVPEGRWLSRPHTEDEAEWLVVFPDGEDATLLHEPEAKCIATLRNAAPALLAELRALRALEVEVRAFVKATEEFPDTLPWKEQVQIAYSAFVLPLAALPEIGETT